MKLGQQLKMTPQLQQAIRLLQLSTMELSQEIQMALDSNPMLEAEDEFQNSDTELAEAESDIDLAVTDGNDAVDEFSEASEAEVSEQFEEPLTESMPGDSTWDDIYPQSFCITFNFLHKILFFIINHNIRSKFNHSLKLSS